MFTKLLKYEWKSTSATLGILSLCALGAGLLGGGVLRFLNYASGQVQLGNAGFAILLIPVSLLLVGLFLGMMAYSVSAGILLYYRFYKSRFTDEGYLTFTLPVTAGQVFWSSFLVILGWVIISGAVTAVSAGLFVFLGAETPISLEEIKAFFSFFEYLFQVDALNLVITVVVSVVSFLANIVYYMTAITVGSIIAKKHKLLAAIGVYIAASLVMSMVNGMMSVFAATTLSEGASMFLYVMETLFTLAMASGACALNIYLMQHKLNLP